MIRNYEMATKITKPNKIIYPELSFKIVGCLFDVFKELGFGHREKFYQQALKQEFIARKLKYKEQVVVDLNYKGTKIGKNLLDFLIEDKVVLEIKANSCYHKKDFEQIKDYLKLSGLQLGILANFTPNGVKQFRILNIKK